MEYNEKYYANISKEYLTIFNRQWNELMKQFIFQQHQFSSGNRLRPLIVLVGYLATKKDCESSQDDYEYISKIALSVEIVHKSSLILDDLIDDDPARHGKPSFHIEYGMENTVMFAIHMLSVSIQNLTDLLSGLPNTHKLRINGLNLLLKTMHDMSLGELMELNLTEESKYDYKQIKEIISLQTSPLITNSLLLGYYAGNGDNTYVKKTLNNIGNQCGYIFQVMNDLEPFCQQEKLKQHKGRINTDISQAKKNIVFSLLYNLLSTKEKEQIQSANNDEEINFYLTKYFDFYKVKTSFMQEIDLTYFDIKKQIPSLIQYGISRNWCSLFSFFIDFIVEQCKSRLN